MTAPKSKRGSPRGTLAKILPLARKLREPAVYLSGVEVGPPLSPRSILLFGRRDARLLADPPEQHHRFVAIAALQGEGSVCVDDRTYRLGPGQAQLIFPFQSHCYLNIDPRIQWVFLGFEHAEDARLDSLRDYGPVPLGERGLQHLMDIFERWHTPPRLDQIPLLVGLLLHHLSGNAQTAPPTRPRSSHDPGESLIAKINLFATRNTTRPFAVGELARHIGLSPSHLRARFHQLTGRSLGRHLRDLRLQHACNLLHNGQDSIGEISQQCGFESLFSFSRAFRHALGCAPTAYRSKHLKVPKV